MLVLSILCSERFFSEFSGFPLFSKTNISEFQFNRMQDLPANHFHVSRASWVNFKFQFHDILQRDMEWRPPLPPGLPSAAVGLLSCQICPEMSTSGHIVERSVIAYVIASMVDDTNKRSSLRSFCSPSFIGTAFLRTSYILALKHNTVILCLLAGGALCFKARDIGPLNSRLS